MKDDTRLTSVPNETGMLEHAVSASGRSGHTDAMGYNLWHRKGLTEAGLFWATYLLVIGLVFLVIFL